MYITVSFIARYTNILQNQSNIVITEEAIDYVNNVKQHDNKNKILI